METHNIYDLGTININSLRAYIIDNNIQQEDTILLHPQNFADLIFDYRQNNHVGISFPFYVLGVLIDRDQIGSLAMGSIKILSKTEERPLAAHRAEVLNAQKKTTTVV